MWRPAGRTRPKREVGAAGAGAGSGGMGGGGSVGWEARWASPWGLRGWEGR